MDSQKSAPPRLGMQEPSVAVVIPCYHVAPHVESVIREIPAWVDAVIAVDDASHRDDTGAVLARLDDEIDRLHVLSHESNRGVGGAMVTGFRKALELGAEYVVKVDGDGQMDLDYLESLLQPLVDGLADYSKGNRFLHFDALDTMPRPRLFGNVALTFMTKAASGCWHIFDVQNGYLAMTGEVLRNLPLDRLEEGYCFENSMLVYVTLQNFSVCDVPMPAVYGDEVSSMNIRRVLFSFPGKLLRLMLMRLVTRHILVDFSPLGVYLLASLPLLLFGIVFGGYHWWVSWATGVAATTGTVVLALLTFLMGFNLLIQAVDLDIRNSPRARGRAMPRSRPPWESAPDLEAVEPRNDSRAGSP